MSNSNKFRLTLGQMAYCDFKEAVRPEKREEIDAARAALESLQVVFTREDGRIIEIETSVTADVIARSIGGLFSLYKIPAPRDLPQVTPVSFLP